LNDIKYLYDWYIKKIKQYCQWIKKEALLVIFMSIFKISIRNLLQS
jgi:hypothetical protein